MTGGEPKGPAVTSLDGTRSEECAARSRRALGHSSPNRPLLLEMAAEPGNISVARATGLWQSLENQEPNPRPPIQMPKAESAKRTAAKASSAITMRSKATWLSRRAIRVPTGMTISTGNIAHRA
jgi:hypothetical protein